MFYLLFPSIIFQLIPDNAKRTEEKRRGRGREKDVLCYLEICVKFSIIKLLHFSRIKLIMI